MYASCLHSRESLSNEEKDRALMTSSRPLDLDRPEAKSTHGKPGQVLINPFTASISLSSISFLVTERRLTHKPQAVSFIIVPSLQIKKSVLLAENRLCNVIVRPISECRWAMLQSGKVWASVNTGPDTTLPFAALSKLTLCAGVS